jgi:putative ABC transport system permease protein
VIRRVLENLRLGTRALLRRPVRTLLVLQGIIWGVAVAIMPPAILLGSHREAQTRAAEVGTDRISLRAHPTSPTPWIDRGDLRAVRERFGPVLTAAGGYRAVLAEATVGDATTAHQAHLIGACGDVLESRGQRIGAGRDLTPEEIESGAPVALVEPGMARALFGSADPVGRSVSIDGRGVFEIVGLVAERSRTALDTDDMGLDRSHPLADWVDEAMAFFGVVESDDAWKRSDRGLIVPLSRVPADHVGGLDWIILRAGPDRAPAESVEIERFLAERGRDVEVRINIVWPILASAQLDRYLVLSKAFFLACLIMGGVVIANLMLLSSIERYREIAIRRTEGATRTDIAVQFICEAFVMGVVGALIGVPLGLGLARVRVALEPVSMIVVIIPWKAVAITSTCAIVTAILAGVLPAVRAARLDPVEALRCE